MCAAYGFSIKEVIAAAEQVCGHAIPSEVVGRRPGDPPILVGDPSRARKILSWKPQRSRLETQISDAWNWMAKNTKAEDVEWQRALP